MLSEMMESFAEEFCFMESKKVPDGEGGFVTRWEDGYPFNVYVAHDTTMEARIAEAQNTASTYTFLIPKNIKLRYLDVIKRIADNEVFQITSDSSDKKTPTISRMELCSVTARKWRLPE